MALFIEIPAKVRGGKTLLRLKVSVASAKYATEGHPQSEEPAVCRCSNVWGPFLQPGRKFKITFYLRTWLNAQISLCI